MYRLTLNEPWTLKGQSYSHRHVVTTPESQISPRFPLRLAKYQEVTFVRTVTGNIYKKDWLK